MRKVLLFLLITFLINLISSATCEETYFFILNNNWEYSQTDLNNFNITENEIYNYGVICADSNHPNLPERNLPEITIYRGNKYCNLDENVLFEASIPFFFEIKLENSSCSRLNKLKYIFKIEEREGDYSIKGISLIIAIFVIVFLIVLSIRFSNNWINKAVKEEENYF